MHQASQIAALIRVKACNRLEIHKYAYKKTRIHKIRFIICKDETAVSNI